MREILHLGIFLKLAEMGIKVQTEVHISQSKSLAPGEEHRAETATTGDHISADFTG